jgi:hypothetical protein
MRTLASCAASSCLALVLLACGSSSSGNAAANAEPGVASGGASTRITESSGDAAAIEQDAAAPVAVADAAPEAAAPQVTFNGLRSIAFRSGARPPRGASPAHGSVAWTVIIAAASQATPELTAVFEQLVSQRFAASVGEVGCTASAGDAYPATISLGASAQIVSVSFRSEREARAFAAALNEQPLWVGRSRIACAD